MEKPEIKTGKIHIYCGDGKGKTTAAMGLCARAAGYGYRVLIYQFMKDNSSSERKTLGLSGRIRFIDGPETEKFSFRMTEKEKADRRLYYREQFFLVTGTAVREHYEVLFLDEIFYAIAGDLFDKNLLLDFIHGKPDDLELILTGRDPDREFLELADYVSEIRNKKHPYGQGLAARMGIER